MKTRVGIVGYGNLGRGMEYAVKQNEDIELRYIFTRREPSQIKPETDGVKVLHVGEVQRLTGEIDVMVLCTGSAKDLPEQTPEFAKLFNVVDSFDTHAKIPEHFDNVDAAAKSGGKTAIISAGWDPGVFSINRLMAEAILPVGNIYTFWGEGVSQGHSDAIRKINGVLDARQYTIPIPEALEAVRSGKNPELDAKKQHTRKCFVVADDGADLSDIKNKIVNMPNYFEGYETTVNFVSAAELEKNHAKMYHGGYVINSGKTGCCEANSQIIEYRLKLDSNPEFTSNVIAVCARAAHRLNKEGFTGCKTMFDIPPAYFSSKSGTELRKKYL